MKPPESYNVPVNSDGKEERRSSALRKIRILHGRGVDGSPSRVVGDVRALGGPVGMAGTGFLGVGRGGFVFLGIGRGMLRRTRASRVLSTKTGPAL